MDTLAVVVEEPERVALRRLTLVPPDADDVVVEVDYSGISMGTEKLMYNGTMPAFPGMGYPLVPGYEAVGTIVDAGANQRDRIGQLCQPLLKSGRSKAIGKRLGKNYGVMAMRAEYSCGRVVRTLWHDEIATLEELAHDIGAVRIHWLD